MVAFLCFLCCALCAAEACKTRLFVVSEQSNMVYLNPDASFTPAVKQAFPNDEVIVVRSAEGGTPIRRWWKEWKDPQNAGTPPAPGDLYDVLMTRVKKSIEGKTPRHRRFCLDAG